MTEEELKHVTKMTLYKRYVARKNEMVTKIVDEDLAINIADKYLSTLANYSVFHGQFNFITRSTARRYSRRMAPFRTWSHDLLQACLSSNLLLNTLSGEESAVMFEYENMGDYYKAEAMLKSKMGVEELVRWLETQKGYFDRHPEVPSEKFKNAVKALSDISCSTRYS